MSWSVSIVGLPEKVNAKLDEYSATLTGQSKEEFDEAKPHLQALVSGNVGVNQIVTLNASGHATTTDGKKTYGNCLVSLSQAYATLAL